MANIGTNTIQDAGAELEAMLHGTTLNDVANPEGMWYRAARRVLEDVDPQETKIVAQFGKVYEGVFDYSLATDVKGNKVVDIYPQGLRTPQDVFAQVYNREFDVTKTWTLKPDFTPRYSGANRTVRIAAANTLNNGILINAVNGVTTNGTWSAINAGTSNLQTSNVLVSEGGYSSVTFTLAAAGSTGGIVNTTSAQVDLTEHYNNADIFLWVYLPVASHFSQVTIRWGSSSTNYYSASATTDAMGNTFQNGWNLIKVAWANATTTGTPNYSAIDYAYIEFTYDGTLQTQVACSQLWSRNGTYFTIEYYSKYLFRDASTGDFKEKTDSDTDFINLDTDAYNLFLFAAAIEACSQVQGAEALYYDAAHFETEYQRSLQEYQSKYKSEIIKPTGFYYKKPDPSYRRFWGIGFYR